MTRQAQLVQLSREHHAALKLARRIANSAPAEDSRELMASVATLFRDELAPHFETEEALLLPCLSRLGETESASRLANEHLHLRDLAQRIAAGHAAALKAFGLALHDHVRFEERELFPRIESLLAARSASLSQFLDAPAR